MKKILFAAFLAVSALTLTAQEKTNKAEVMEGPEVEAKKTYLKNVIGNDATGYYITRYVKKKLLLEHINKELVTDKSYEIPVKKMRYEGIKRGYYDIIMIGNNLYMLSTIYEKKSNNVTLFAQAIDKNTLVPDEDLKTIYIFTFTKSRGEMLRSGDIEAMQSFRISYAISEDKSRVLFYRNTGDSETNPKEKMHLYVFDDKLNSKWENEIELPYQAALFSINDVTVNDDGNAFLTGIEYQYPKKSRKSRSEDVPSYKYHLLSYKEKGKKMRDYTIELSNNFITDVRIGIAPNGDLVAVGFYSEKGSFSVKGAFYMTIDSETSLTKKQKTTAFETDFITQNMSDHEKQRVEENEAKGEGGELYDYDLNNLILQNDGGATIIAEQYHMYTVTTTSPGANGITTTHTWFHYDYNDIITLSFNADGSLAWKNKIPKRQHSVNDNGASSSYAYTIMGNKLYLIINDNPKNLFLKDSEQAYASFGKEIAVSLIEIDANTGKTTRELLFTTTRGDIELRTKMCKQTGDNEMLIYGTRRKTYQFGKVTFKK